MDKVFDTCVEFLQYLAEKTGLTYKQINVLIFCVGFPAFTIWLAYKASQNK